MAVRCRCWACGSADLGGFLLQTVLQIIEEEKYLLENSADLEEHDARRMFGQVTRLGNRL